MRNAVPRNRSDIFIIRITDKSLPPGGEGVAPATDEGETGERTHVTPPSSVALPFYFPRKITRKPILPLPARYAVSSARCAVAVACAMDRPMPKPLPEVRALSER